MSSVLGVGSSSSTDLAQMLQALARKQAAATSDTTSTESTQSGTSRRAEFESMFEEALVAAGLDSSKIDDLKADIKAAVASVLSNSDGTSDPREAVGQAIEQTLEEYGVDTDKLKEGMDSQMASMQPPPGPPPGGMSDMGGTGGGQEDFSTKISSALEAAGVDSTQTDEIQSAIEAAVAAVKEDGEEGTDGGGDIKAAVQEVLTKYGVDADAFNTEMESGMSSAPPPGPPSGGQGQSVSETSGQAQGGWIFGAIGGAGSTSQSSAWLAGLFQMIDEQA